MILRLPYTFIGYYFTLVVFGVCGLALSGFALLCGALPPTERTERFFQRLIHRHFAFFVWWTSFSRLHTVRYHGFARRPARSHGCVLVANHPGLTDITSLLARTPEAFCIFKPAIRRNPVLGAAARRAGYLASDGGHHLVRQAAAKVGAGHTLIIFPEGTRTPVGATVSPLKPGFVLIARRAAAPIQLVRITSSRPVLAKDRAWWKLPPLPATVEVTLGPCLHVHPSADPTAAAAEIEAWFRAAPDVAAGQHWSPALTFAPIGTS